MAWIFLMSIYIGAACRDRPHCESVLPPLADLKYFDEAVQEGTLQQSDFNAMVTFIYMVNADKYRHFDQELYFLKKTSPICSAAFGAIAKYEKEGYDRLKSDSAKALMVEYPKIGTFSFEQTKEVFETKVAKLSIDAQLEIKSSFKEIFELLKETAPENENGIEMEPNMQKIFRGIIEIMHRQNQ